MSAVEVHHCATLAEAEAAFDAAPALVLCNDGKRTAWASTIVQAKAFFADPPASKAEQIAAHFVEETTRKLFGGEHLFGFAEAELSTRIIKAIGVGLAKALEGRI